MNNNYITANGLIGFEYDITAHCNLNCAGCSHYSPIAEKEFVTAEQAQRELSRIGDVAGGKCEYIHIMGGEPLLNPELEQILKIARTCFPVGEIQLVTNGILLAVQPDSFWEICRDNSVSLHITKYPVKIPMTRIRAFATTFGVELKWFRSGDRFIKYTIDHAAGHDEEQAFTLCPMHECAQYHNGKLYHCSITGCVYKLNKAFDCSFEISDGDYIDIFGDVTVEDVLAFMSRPIPFCRYCNPMEWRTQNQFSWHISECVPEEWIKTEGEPQ